jgi:hypothetical protein
MRLISMNTSGNVHAAVDLINSISAANVVFQIIGEINPIVVFKLEDYPSYLRLCEKLERKPLSAKGFFSPGSKSFGG